VRRPYQISITSFHWCVFLYFYSCTWHITHVAHLCLWACALSLSPPLLDVNCLHVRVLLLIYTSSNSHSSPLMPLAHGYKNLTIVPLCSVPHLSSFCALHRTTPSAQPPTQTGLTRCLSVLVGKVAVPRYPSLRPLPVYYKNLTSPLLRSLSPRSILFYFTLGACTSTHAQCLVETCVSHI
jgi:hypothetical protein